MNLHKLRLKRRMSLAVLATKAGYSREYVARLETGHHDPSPEHAYETRQGFGVPVTPRVE